MCLPTARHCDMDSMQNILGSVGPRVLVYEPCHSGHRLNYARLVIEAVRPYSSNIVFCTTEFVVSSSEYSTVLSESVGDCEVDAQPERRSLWKGSFRRARHLQLAIKRHKPDFVYVPTADGVIQCYGWLRLLSGQFTDSPINLKCW